MGDCNVPVPVNIVILGNKGHGKSSLGNFILDNKTFPVSGNGLSPIRTVGYGTGNRGNFIMKVVEIPAYPDRPNDQAYREMIKRANRLCDRNIHLFLLVIKFGCANSVEYLPFFDRWRRILGSKTFQTRGVIVITFGEEFKLLMEKNNTPDKRFSDWCREQVGSLENLFKQCNQRRILFDNAHTERTFEDLSKYMRELSHTAYNFNESTLNQNNSSSWRDVIAGVVVVILGLILVFNLSKRDR